MSKITKAYKVVNQNIEGRLYSTIRRTAYNYDVKDFVVEYKIGEFVGPQFSGSKLYCFKRYSDAKEFVSLLTLSFNSQYSIYECEALNVRSNTTIVKRFADIAKFWSTKKKHKSTKSFVFNKDYSIVNGSWQCDAIKLVKLVDC